MKIQIFIFVLCCIACSSKKNERIKEINTLIVNNDQETSLIIKKQKTSSSILSDSTFNIINYKQRFDSVSRTIKGAGRNVKLKADTLKPNELIFVELKNTELENITNKAISTIKYSFLLESGDSRLKTYLIILSFASEIESEFNFNVFERVALEKNGIPGLTYTNDYLIKIDKKIYWINSSCSYSYTNHLKFVNIFRDMLNTKGKKVIKCKCGQVKCISSIE